MYYKYKQSTFTIHMYYLCMMICVEIVPLIHECCLFVFLENSHETTGDKLLQSYQRLRLENIIITSFASRQFFNPFLINHFNVLLILLFGFSFIAVVPPTPPPFKEVPSFNRSEVKRIICIIIFFLYVSSSPYNLFVCICHIGSQNVKAIY